MTEDQLIEYIKSQLGYPLVKIELTDDQIRYNIKKAKDEYIKWSYDATEEVTWTMPLVPYQTEYELPVGITSVYDVKDFSAGRLGSINTLFTTGNVLWNMGFYNFLRGGHYSLVSYYLAKQYMDVIDRYIGDTYVWNYYRFANTLQIQPAPPSGDYILTEDGYVESPGFILLRGFTMAPYGLETSDMGAFESGLYNLTWIKDASVAYTKKNLGMVRRKFENNPGISNTSIQLDGSDLISEAKEEIEQLEEKLRTEEGLGGGLGDIIIG